jgi:hypothetical protein
MRNEVNSRTNALRTRKIPSLGRPRWFLPLPLWICCASWSENSAGGGASRGRESGSHLTTGPASLLQETSAGEPTRPSLSPTGESRCRGPCLISSYALRRRFQCLAIDLPLWLDCSCGECRCFRPATYYGEYPK